MPKLTFSICSELVSIDMFTKNISIFHILEDIHAANFPFSFPRLFVTLLWQRNENEENVEFESLIKLMNPKNKQMKEWKVNLKFAKLRHRHIVGTANQKFDIPGQYVFKIYIRRKAETVWGKPVFKFPLLVHKATLIKPKEK